MPLLNSWGYQVSELHLIKDVLAKDIGMEPTRKGFGRGLLEAGRRDENVVAACADLTDSTQISLFAKEFPDRFIEIGVAEQNLATVGSGMAAMGKIPFVSSYAAFSPGRNWEQIKTTVALNDLPVKIVGAHAGLYTGADGATHQMLEDIALMRVMPNMVVIVPGDEDNLKITQEADFARALRLMDKTMDIRVGNGFDVHRFEAGDHVWLCGVRLPFTNGLNGHSDWARNAFLSYNEELSTHAHHRFVCRGTATQRRARARDLRRERYHRSSYGERDIGSGGS